VVHVVAAAAVVVVRSHAEMSLKLPRANEWEIKIL
jgi:hypothetical protein